MHPLHQIYEQGNCKQSQQEQPGKQSGILPVPFFPVTLIHQLRYFLSGLFLRTHERISGTEGVIYDASGKQAQRTAQCQPVQKADRKRLAEKAPEQRNCNGNAVQNPDHRIGIFLSYVLKHENIVYNLFLKIY